MEYYFHNFDVVHDSVVVRPNMIEKPAYEIFVANPAQPYLWFSFAIVPFGSCLNSRGGQGILQRGEVRSRTLYKSTADALPQAAPHVGTSWMISRDGCKLRYVFQKNLMEAHQHGLLDYTLKPGLSSAPPLPV